MNLTEKQKIMIAEANKILTLLTDLTDQIKEDNENVYESTWQKAGLSK